ncbi:hypothetical protein FACS189483_01530 [Spirochaetia bacterium]|nr:hypothetical protein FACS189483_01530 [Spirochaetia bacterium]
MVTGVVKNPTIPSQEPRMNDTAMPIRVDVKIHLVYLVFIRKTYSIDKQ